MAAFRRDDNLRKYIVHTTEKQATTRAGTYPCEHPRFGEHLRSISKSAPGFPVAEHFSSNGHTIADALVRGIKLCGGNKQRKKQEMRLIFRLGTCQPRGLNADFHFI